MAFLNRQEREQLRDELKKLTFNQAKGRLHRIDPKGRLAYLRNMQGTNKYLTRFELIGMGTRVTLVEHLQEVQKRDGKYRAEYELVDVVVEPRPENRT